MLIVLIKVEGFTGFCFFSVGQEVEVEVVRGIEGEGGDLVLILVGGTDGAPSDVGMTG